MSARDWRSLATDLSVMQRTQMGWVKEVARSGQKPYLYFTLLIWNLVHRLEKGSIKYREYILSMHLPVFYSR